MRNKNMLKISVFAAFIAVFVFSGVMANAQNGSGQNVRQPETVSTEESGDAADESVDENTEASRQTAQERAEQAKLQKQRGHLTAIKRLMANQINRAARAISRMSNILDRIESRSEKLAAAGVDASEFEDLIEAAQEQETETLAALEKLKSDWSALQEDVENPRPLVQQFMTSANTLKRQVIEFHRSLMAIVKAMRQAAQDEDDEEESTPTPTPTSAPSSTPTPTSMPAPSITPTVIPTPTETES